MKTQSSAKQTKQPFSGGDTKGLQPGPVAHQIESSEQSNAEQSPAELSHAEQAPAELSHTGQLRRLQLELQMVRRQADAARLDAQAAALELTICKLTDSHSVGPLPKPASDAEVKQLIDDLPAERQIELQALLSSSISGTDTPVRRLDDTAEQVPPKTKPAGDRSGKTRKSKRDGRHQTSQQQKPKQTVQAAESRRPPADWSSLSQRKPSNSQRKPSNSQRKPSNGKLPSQTQPLSRPAANDHQQIQELSQQQSVTKKRRRPAVWIASGILHALMLFSLASWTLGTRDARDQVSIQASVSDADSFSVDLMETPAASEAVPEETTPSEAEVEIDFGLPAAAIPPVVGMPTIEISQPALNPALPTATSQTLTTLADAPQAITANTEFCGIEGGGNNFVYLVDSSSSMGAAFESARRELTQAINALSAEQRFYVIFFDTESDYLSLRGDHREDFAVTASEANKQAFANWAGKIQMDRGKAPYEALEYAIDLQPDVIFLLSDGEFPQRIEEHLRELNHSENLFGQSSHSSIIHTIGYHSREGEARMRSIAQQNGGQYRYVPKP